MQREIINEKPRIHNRDISPATYPHNNSKIVVKGTLTDKSHKKFLLSWKIKEPDPNEPACLSSRIQPQNQGQFMGNHVRTWPYQKIEVSLF